MFTLNEKDFGYRHGDHGPKYLMMGPRTNFGIVRLLAGEVVAPHMHRVMEEDFYVLEGRVEIEVGGEVLTAEEGQFIHIEPGEPHRLENSGNIPVRLVVVAAPFAESDKYTTGGEHM